MIHVTINGKPVEVSEGSTIMEAAETVGIRIPSLCHMKNVHQYGSRPLPYLCCGSGGNEEPSGLLHG